MPELLEFEEPVGVLLKEIEALSMLPKTPERERSIASLRRRAEEIREISCVNVAEPYLGDFRILQ